MGGVSNEIFFKSAPEKLTLMVLILLLKDTILHKIGAEI